MVHHLDPPLVYFRKHLFWHYRLQLYFVYKTVSQISFNLFWSGDKRLSSEFLRKWGWFHGRNKRFPKYLGFVDERALITTTLISSSNWKTLVSFCLRKKRAENAFLTLTMNYRKIVQKNKLCHSKQH